MLHGGIGVTTGMYLWRNLRLCRITRPEPLTSMAYRRIHHVKFSAFHGAQLEYNGSQEAQMEQVKLEDFNLKGMKSTED